MQKNIFSTILLINALAVLNLSIAAIDLNSPDEVLRYVFTLLPEKPVILEAGGHHGEDTARMKSLSPNAVMHVFEPLPTSFAKLTNATKNLPEIYRYPYALGNHSGTSCFYINPNNDGASSIGKPVKIFENEFNREPISVNCLTLDEWAKTTGINFIDFMWLDMEGNELCTLEKATSILPTVKAIYTEINFIEIRKGACLYDDLKRFLLSYGFREIWRSTSDGRQGNALFIK